MEQRKEGLSPGASPAAKGPKLRKKLRKSVIKQQNNFSGWFSSGSGGLRQALASNQCDTANYISRPQPRRQPSSLPFLDTNNIQRVEFSQLGRNGCSYETERHSQPIMPKPCHLFTSNRQAPASPVSDPTTCPRPKMRRRRAKTPIFTIGQLDDSPRPSNPPGRASSVDLIADQYDALLQLRRGSGHTECQSELPSAPPGGGYGGEDDADTPMAGRRPPKPPVCPREDEAPSFESPFASAEYTGCSPISDDGTLVSFDEQAVYFKPISFHSEPPSPLSPSNNTNGASDAAGGHPPAAADSAADTHGNGDGDGDGDGNDNGNVSLQICLDLLTRELSSAYSGRPSRSPTTSASQQQLQVWAMIEAYEGLRDQLAEGSGFLRDKDGDDEERRSLKATFDLWLRALYSLHDSLGAAGHGKAREGEKDYGKELEVRS